MDRRRLKERGLFRSFTLHTKKGLIQGDLFTDVTQYQQLFVFLYSDTEKKTPPLIN